MLFSEKDGLPRKAFPNGWKGEKGLYSVGFTRRGLMGTSVDARRVAHDVEQQWRKAKGTHRDGVPLPLVAVVYHDDGL